MRLIPLLFVALSMSATAQEEPEMVERTGDQITMAEQFRFEIRQLAQAYEKDPADTLHRWGHKLGDRLDAATVGQTVLVLIDTWNSLQKRERELEWSTVCENVNIRDNAHARELMQNRDREHDKALEDLWMGIQSQLDREATVALREYIDRARYKTTIAETATPYQGDMVRENAYRRCNVLSAQGGAK